MGKVSFSLVAVVAQLWLMLPMSSAFAPPAPLIQQGQGTFCEQNSPTRIWANTDDDKDEKKKTDGDTSVDQWLTSRNRPSNLFMDLGQIITAGAWIFLVLGFVLNIFGYDYVVKDNRLAIDTMEASQFRQEIIKEAKSDVAK